MKKIIRAIAFSVAAGAVGMPAWAGGLLLRDGDFVAVCGDSITEQRLYSVLIEDYLLMCIGTLREYAPNEKAALDRLSGVVVKTARDAREGSVKLVTPVRHMLKIEPIR